MTLTKEQAAAIMLMHTKGTGSKVIAIEVGEAIHVDMVKVFGERWARIERAWVKKTNFQCSQDISVWIVERKEGEQFMSQMGHKVRERAEETRKHVHHRD